MILKNHGRAMLSVISLIFTLGAVQAVRAQGLTAPNSPSDQNEWKGATTGLGSSHRFASAAAAQNHCGSTDPVVWSDGYHLTYELPGSPGYGKSNSNYGFYACKSEADDAGFTAAAD